MATIDITGEMFEKTISEGTVLIDFWADWCGPCKMFGPIFEKVSEDYPDVTFAKVDTEANREFSGQLGIMSIPTLMAFRDGILVFSQPGALREPQLVELIGKINELDMDDVRRQIEEAKAAQSETGEE
ncbi:MAG: thioredoxin [Arachnia propionica]|nr:MAG: thioredoxin [Arachnia propionica]